MNNKGLSLVELILSIALIGLISISTLPLITFGYTNLFSSSKYVDEAYDVQQEIEQTMEEKRDVSISEGDPDSFTVEIFGKDITGHHIVKQIPDTGNSHGEINVFVPEYKVVYTVPVVDEGDVVVTAYRDGVLIPEEDAGSIFPLATPETESTSSSYITFKATEPDVSTEEFLLNVYRWYMSPVTTTPPNKNDLIIVKEWNEARTPLSFEDSNDLTHIPNIEENYDELDLREVYAHLYPSYPNLSEEDELELAEKINDRFSGRYFYYSVTPYSTIGRIGKEEISQELIASNKISSISDIYVTVPVSADKYYPNDNYPEVQAIMLDSTNLTVPAIWSPAEIDVSSAGEKTSHGTVVGYTPGVDLYIDVEFINITDFEINPDTLSISVGQEFTLTPAFTPSNATDKTVNWSSSNESIATVDANGKVTGVAVGTATITGTTVDGGFTDTVDVTVEVGNLNSVTISGTPTVGSTLNSVLDPLDATGSVNYQWQVSEDGGGTFNDIVGAISNTYTISSDNNYKYIRLTAEGTGAYQGTVSSESIFITPGHTGWISASSNNIISTVVRNPSNAYNSDNNRTAIETYGVLDYMFTLDNQRLPDDAEIKGVEIRLEGRRESSSGVANLRVVIYKNSTNGDEKQTENLSYWNDDIIILGSSTDLWGLSWTPYEIKNDLKARTDSLQYVGEDAELDHIEIRVHYDMP
jgi:hypothetical protein